MSVNFKRLSNLLVAHRLSPEDPADMSIGIRSVEAFTMRYCETAPGVDCCPDFCLIKSLTANSFNFSFTAVSALKSVSEYEFFSRQFDLIGFKHCCLIRTSGISPHDFLIGGIVVVLVVVAVIFALTCIFIIGNVALRRAEKYGVGFARFRQITVAPQKE